MPQLTEQLESLNPAEQIADHSQAAHDVAKVALGETLVPVSHPLEVGGMVIETNLPDGVQPLVDSPSQELGQALQPTELDALPVGSFFLAHAVEQDDEWGRPETVEIRRELQVLETPKGKALTAESFKGHWEMGFDSAELMSTLGFVIDSTDPENPRIAAAPTPETVKGAAAEAGVDIEFFAGLPGLIPGREYLGAYARGLYAASASNEGDYMHDIQDDHLTAMVLGGEPLKSALQTISKEALVLDDQSIIDTTAKGVDSYTATLRAVLSDGAVVKGEAYGREQGRFTLNKIGLSLGIPIETTQKILVTAQENAPKYAITPKELR